MHIDPFIVLGSAIIGLLVGMTGAGHELIPRPVATVAIGALGGLIVGMTSVGSGSLMIVMLLFLYPLIGANQLVGTDLTQAVPLTLAAALGALAFGHVELSVTASLILGSVPAVFVGSMLSSTIPDRYIRPVIAFVIFASGLKYVGVGTTALGWILCAILLGAATFWLLYARPWRRRPEVAAPEGASALELAPDPADWRRRSPPGEGVLIRVLMRSDGDLGEHPVRPAR